MLRVCMLSAVFLLLGTGCEAQTATACDPRPLDILLILDESGSVGPANFQKTLVFAQNVVSDLDIGPFGVQIGVLTFDSIVRLQFHLNTFSTKQDVLNSVAQTAYHGGSTNTFSALEYAWKTCFTSANGMRPHAAQVVIVITDGKSNAGPNPAIEADRLRDKGITVFSIGVGGGPDVNELNAIASDPDSAHVFSVSDFDSLSVILGSLQQAACKSDAAFLCAGQADIVFLLDMSTIFNDQHLEQLRQFVTGIADKFIIGPQNVQIGVDTFSTHFKHEFYLRENGDQMGLESAVSSISRAEGDTNTANALKRMREESFTAGAGHRANAAKIAILVTDSRSSDAQLTISEAQDTLVAGITVLAVGVGQDVDIEELQEIATGPDNQAVYMADEFDALASLEDVVAAEVCGGVEQPLGGTPISSTCGTKADIVFAIDSSASLGERNFKLILSFIIELIQGLDTGHNSIRVGIETFDSRPESQIHLNRFYSKADLTGAITDISYRSRGTDLGAAIEHMDNIMFQSANGDRPGVPNIGIIITDDNPGDLDKARAAAQTAKDNGIAIFTIGVGDAVSRSELNEIASNPDNVHVLTVIDFSKLNAVTSIFLAQVCQDIPVILPPYVAPGSTSPTPGVDPCRDWISNCAAYDSSVCSTHLFWATTFCARTCTICMPTNQTVVPPCVDKLPNCSSDASIHLCGENRAWAMENCRESCGYCSPGTQTGGFFNKCSYKGVQYSQGDKWDDGCSYECECTDASTGRYQCYNKCPSYYNIPDECTLVQIPGQCCLEPYCDFGNTHTTKDVSASCTFNRRNYQEGEVWSVGCQFECICVDPSLDFYSCQSKCPQYGVLPSNCKMMRTPGECCERPVCEFQTLVRVFTGVGGPSGPGVNRMNETMTQCEDNIPDCETYQRDFCSPQTNVSFVLDNCRKSCDLCDQNMTMTSSPTDVCVYQGQTYSQGEAWTDGCNSACICENATFGYYRCEDRCPEFLDLLEGCMVVTVPGQCCRALYCEILVIITSSQTLNSTVGAVPVTYQVPQAGQYPTLPPGHTYAPGQNPNATLPPSPIVGPNQVYTQFGTGCSPVEEGHPTTMTCDLNTTTCSNLFMVKWKTDRGDLSTCTKTACGNIHSRSVINSTTSISDDNSTLTVSSVSRTSPHYTWDTPWTCSPCGAVEVIVCNRLEIYTSPQNVSCTVSEDIQSVTISCSTDRVYPAAQCSFERTKDGGTPVLITTTPTYNHKPTGESPVYYRSECSVSVPVEDLGEGTHSFQGYIYPDVTGGKSLVTPVPSTWLVYSESKEGGKSSNEVVLVVVVIIAVVVIIVCVSIVVYVAVGGTRTTRGAGKIFPDIPIKLASIPVKDGPSTTTPLHVIFGNWSGLGNNVGMMSTPPTQPESSPV